MQVFDSTFALTIYNLLCANGPMHTSKLQAAAVQVHSASVIEAGQFDRALDGLNRRKLIVVDKTGQTAVRDALRRIVVARDLTDCNGPDAARGGWKGWIVRDKTTGAGRALDSIIGESP